MMHAIPCTSQNNFLCVPTSVVYFTGRSLLGMNPYQSSSQGWFCGANFRSVALPWINAHMLLCFLASSDLSSCGSRAPWSVLHGLCTLFWQAPTAAGLLDTAGSSSGFNSYQIWIHPNFFACRRRDRAKTNKKNVKIVIVIATIFVQCALKFLCAPVRLQGMHRRSTLVALFTVHHFCRDMAT